MEKFNKGDMVGVRQTRKSLIANVTDAWKWKFCHDGEWDSKEYERIYWALIDLGHRTTKEAIDRVIGNDTWTKNTCNCCGEDCEEVMAYKYVDTEEVVMQICDECNIINRDLARPVKSILEQYTDLRKSVGITIEEAAHQIKISRQLMSFYENGQRYPSPEIEKRMEDIIRKSSVF